LNTLYPGCLKSSDVNKSLAGGFPTQLTAPNVKPSSFFTPPLQLRNAAPGNITVFAPKMQLPTVHEWNFGIQRELPWGLVMQAAYIGRRGERLFMAYNANQINADAIVPSFLIMQQYVAITGCRASGTPSTCAPC